MSPSSAGITNIQPSYSNSGAAVSRAISPPPKPSFSSYGVMKSKSFDVTRLQRPANGNFTAASSVVTGGGLASLSQPPRVRSFQ
jgi:hypothetical protein